MHIKYSAKNITKNHINHETNHEPLSVTAVEVGFPRYKHKWVIQVTAILVTILSTSILTIIYRNIKQ